MKKTIDLIGVASDSGLHIKGTSLGSTSFRQNGIIQAIESLNLEINDLGDLTPDAIADNNCSNGLKKLNEVNCVNTKLYHSVIITLSENRFPLILGGDHSLAVGSCLAAKTAFDNIGLIWIDAHGDFNTDKITGSGNIHGMSYSAVTTGEPCQIIPFYEKAKGFINPENCVLIGVRDLDKEEEIRLINFGITVISMQDIFDKGIKNAIDKVISVTSGIDSPTSGIYLSFDIDSLDPALAPAVSTPVGNGLEIADVQEIFDAIKQTNKLIGAEFVELNPLKDVDNKTAKAVINLICRLLS